MDTQFVISVALPAKKVPLFDSRFQEAKEALKEMFTTLEKIEALMTSHKKSGDVFRINSANGAWVTLSPWTFEVLKKSIMVAKMSGGAFDPTWVGLRPIYRIKDPGWTPPQQSAVNHALGRVGYGQIKLDSRHTRVQLSKKNGGVDLGGIAKGYSLQVMADTLKKRGFLNFIINGGGDLVVSGRHPDREWTVAVRHPRKKGQHLFVGSIKPGAIVTSGDYERYIMVGKERYSHILDPRTGRPSKGLLSVTLHGPDATVADALATAVFVMGEREGMALINATPTYECVIMNYDQKITKSKGFDLIWKSR